MHALGEPDKKQSYTESFGERLRRHQRMIAISVGDDAFYTLGKL